MLFFWLYFLIILCVSMKRSMFDGVHNLLTFFLFIVFRREKSFLLSVPFSLSQKIVCVLYCFVFRTILWEINQ